MPTITTLLMGSVVVFGIGLGGTLLAARVLARLAARHRQSIQVELDWRRPRLQVTINNDDPKQEIGASPSTGR